MERNQGNFPIETNQVDVVDPITGELLFVGRVSSQMRFLNSKGQEIPDPVPHSPALGAKPQTSIRDYIRSLVHHERLQADLAAQGHETFEEADDFEVGDDYFPDSQYENDLEPSIAELVREGTASLSAKATAEAQRRAAEARKPKPGDFIPPEPEKSPRKARKGLADEVVGVYPDDVG